MSLFTFSELYVSLPQYPSGANIFVPWLLAAAPDGNTSRVNLKETQTLQQIITIFENPGVSGTASTQSFSIAEELSAVAALVDAKLNPLSSTGFLTYTVAAAAAPSDTFSLSITQSNGLNRRISLFGFAQALPIFLEFEQNGQTLCQVIGTNFISTGGIEFTLAQSAFSAVNDFEAALAGAGITLDIS